MRVFFSDLDGTLLTSENIVSARTREAINAFVAAGNKFVICTGRPLSNAVRMQQRFGLDFPGSLLSAFNGAVLYDTARKTVIHETGIPVGLVGEIFDLAWSMDIFCVTYRDHYIISPEYTEDLEYYLGQIDMPVILNRDVTSELTQPPWKIIAIDLQGPGRLQIFKQAMDAHFGRTVRTVFSSDIYLEIFPSDAGKGNALVRLCEILGVPLENSLAAGDEENDLSMIRAAGTGIAMCNGSKVVKDIADVITSEDNDHDGLIPFLQP